VIRLLKKIEALVVDVLFIPLRGIGKHEALNHDFSQQWPSRINKEYRIIYDLTEHFQYMLLKTTL